MSSRDHSRHMGRLTHVQTCLTALLLLSSVTAPLAAAADPLPVPAPTPDTWKPGYDFAERVGAAHVLLDARDYHHTVPLDEVDGAVIDLEMKNLSAGRTYYLEGPLERLRGFADQRGHAVFWALPANAGTWTMTDGRSGLAELMVVLEPRTHAEVPVCWPYCWNKHELVRSPTEEAVEGGWNVEQVAYSFTPDAKVEITSCWSHGIEVGAKATAGFASNEYSAGADYRYTGESCLKFASQGNPVQFESWGMFQKDTYEDGSWKVYAVDTADKFRLRVMHFTFDPPPDAEVWLVDAGQPAPVISRLETEAGAVTFQASTKVFGTGLDVAMAATGETTTTIEVTLQPPDMGTAEYRVWFVNGNGKTTGIAAAVWRIE